MHAGKKPFGYYTCSLYGQGTKQCKSHYVRYDVLYTYVLSRIQTELAKEKQTITDAEKWIALIKQYADPKELTSELLNALIEKIVVHHAVKNEGGSKDQEIEIYYRFIGKID